MRVERQSNGMWRVIGAQGWGVGVDFPSEADALAVARVIEAAAVGDAAQHLADIREALAGDSNDAEHEALAGVAAMFGVED